MKILLATDGSGHAQIAEALIVKCPCFCQAKVLAVSVAASPHLALAGMQPYEIGALAHEIEVIAKTARERAKEAAEGAATRLTKVKVDAEAVVLDGEAGTELLDFAAKEGPDLVAVGSRGLGAVRSAILGSIARKLVAHAKCSVLIGRLYPKLEYAATVERIRALNKLTAVVAADGTDGANAGIEAVKSCGKRAFEKITVVSATPLSVVPADVDPTAFAQFYRYDEERGKAIAERTAKELQGLAEKVVPITDLGRPASLINGIAERESADVIVVGATRHGMLERFLIGSVSYEIATTAPCSVWVVRPKAKKN